MVWEVKKQDRINFLIGTAHFSPYHYRKSLRHYIEISAKVVFEGPLDDESRKQIVAMGMQKNGADILKGLDEPTVLKLRNLMEDLFVSQNALSLISSWPLSKDQFLSEFFQNRRPWLAFFQIWAHFLRKHGWRYSLDLEAWQMARKWGKEIIFLETIPEQIAGLEGIPLERIVSFLKKIDFWEELTKNYAQLYAEGEIEALLAATKDFPTRCPSIVENRDPVMFSRLRSIFAEGRGTAFLGTVHLPGINKRLQQEEYELKQILNIT
ncbi:MAG: TraB/GumN family protein [Thermodesulfobacteriota bacterium]